MAATRIIGLIGGLGPAATAIYRHALAAASEKAGRRLRLIEATADVAAVLQAAGASNTAGVTALLARHVYALKARGAGVMAVAAVTPHMAADALRELASGCEFIDLVAVLNEELLLRRLSVVGLIGTRAVLRSRLFGRLAIGMAPVTEARMIKMHDLYVSIVSQRAVPAGVAEELFLEASRQMADGAEAVVLAGTELSLIAQSSWSGTPIIDCSKLHVDAILSAACRERTD